MRQLRDAVRGSAVALDVEGLLCCREEVFFGLTTLGASAILLIEPSVAEVGGELSYPEQSARGSSDHWQSYGSAIGS